MGCHKIVLARSPDDECFSHRKILATKICVAKKVSSHMFLRGPACELFLGEYSRVVFPVRRAQTCLISLSNTRLLPRMAVSRVLSHHQCMKLSFLQNAHLLYSRYWYDLTFKFFANFVDIKWHLVSTLMGDLINRVRVSISSHAC